MLSNSPDLEEFFGLRARLTGQMSGFALSDAAFAKRLEKVDPFRTATVFGALLTAPDLQSNCLRLEMLIHQTLALGRTRKRADNRWIATTFRMSGDGLAGRLEDPAEDVFVAQISTSYGNFRVLEGTWEGAEFFLQRFINILDGMPNHGPYARLRQSVFSLLTLSDILCERAGLSRYQSGEVFPLNELPKNIADRLSTFRQRIRFTPKELGDAGIDIRALSPFIFAFNERQNLLSQRIGRSSLERHPLIINDGDIWFILPTATSAAIRLFLIEFLDQSKQHAQLISSLSNEYTAFFSDVSLLGDLRGIPLRFERSDGRMVASASTKVDVGRYINIIAVLDTLEEFQQSQLGGSNPDENSILSLVDHFVTTARDHSISQADFVEGLTLLVLCGVGRTAIYNLNKPPWPDWRIEFISAYDALTLSMIEKFKPLSLWRILDGRDAVTKAGVGLQNINGLLNMVAWSYSLEGHLVPHGNLPDDFDHGEAGTFIVIPQNGLLELRRDGAVRCDVHMEQDINDVWRRVRHVDSSLIAEDDLRPIYFCDEPRQRPGQQSVFLTNERRWWFDIFTPDVLSGSAAFEYWKLAMTWIVRAAPILERRIPSIPKGAILIEFKFEAAGKATPNSVDAVGFTEARESMTIKVASKSIEISVGAPFEHATFNVDNLAERALVGAICQGTAQLAGGMLSVCEEEDLAWEIVRAPAARQRHIFQARTFRDFVQDDIGRKPIAIDRDDNAIMQLGLGWRSHDKSDGPWIIGKEACISFLNRVVTSIQDELQQALVIFDRGKLIEILLRNHEAAAVDSDRWQRTAAAVLALSQDEEAIRETMTMHQHELGAVTQTSRLLIELALCASPVDEGRAPGELDLSRLMAKVGAIHAYGGWAGAMRWDVMEPRLKITTLGDIHANVGFMDEIVNPFGRAFNDSRVDDAVENYARHLENLEPTPTTIKKGDDLFHAAFVEEMGASLHEFRTFIDFVEDFGIKTHCCIITIKYRELFRSFMEECPVTIDAAEAILEKLTLRPRASWVELPEGYTHSDLELWRHRRRLSPLRRPLIQIDNTDDPTLLVAPGLARDALGYIVGNYYSGAFPGWQLGGKMRSWQARIADKRGRAFSAEVAGKLEAAGWETATEVKISKILRKGFARNYGDVDVLAWNKTSGRVLIIECKDVQFRKTLGDMAEQLSEFRGEIVGGKPDYLRKHLDRIDLMSEHLREVANFIRWSEVDILESHLVFKHTVPMEFALKRMKERVSTSTVDNFLAAMR